MSAASRSGLTSAAVAVAVVVVLLWRFAALWRPSSLVSIPDSLRLPMSALGVLFLVCGVAAWCLRPGRWTGVFLLYALGGAVHWGGSIGAVQPGVERGLLFGYLAASYVSEAGLLHLALIYPRGAAARGWLAALYAPAMASVTLAFVGSWVPKAILEGLAGGLLLVASALSYAAVAVLLIRLLVAEPAARRAARLGLIVGGLVLGGGAAVLGSSGLLFGEPQAWNLAMGILPLCIAIALVGQTIEAGDD